AEEAERAEDRQPHALSPLALRPLPRSLDVLASPSPRPTLASPWPTHGGSIVDRGPPAALRPRALSLMLGRPRPRLAPPAEGEEWAECPPHALSPQPRLPRPFRVISQRSTIQQPHVEDRRPSRLHDQESVISRRSTVQQPHVEDRKPSRLHDQETIISRSSTVQQPHALGVTIGRVEDIEHTPPSHDMVGECPFQASNDVYEDNSQEIIEENSNHQVAPTTSICKVRRT
ncbi:hypothetical protein Taro_034569, partial [Colocasia esculenta]|nr:hypothetical protein [Colocasia esculenta]